MLITRLGTTRNRLLRALGELGDEQVNRPSDAGWTGAQIVRHLAATERQIAADILSALGGASSPVAERDIASLRAELPRLEQGAASESAPATRAELVDLLEDARFRHLQHVFNETHERVLAAKSMVHPLFGPISLKNLVDLIWLHEAHHLSQIEDLRHAGRAAVSAVH